MGDATAQRIWNAALGQLQIRVTRPNYDTWLKDTLGLELSDGHFVVGAPNEFVKEWLCTRMRTLVSQTIAAILGRPVEVSFQITGRNGDRPDGGADLPLASVPSTQAVISSPAPKPRLNPKYSFQNFLVGASNRLAAAAAMAAASSPGEEYNPLFVYGAPGLGKTHLLQAIAQRAAHCNHRPHYVTSEQFTNDFVTAIAHSRADEFRRRYRSPDVLLVDDIQFLAGKERTQEEFFYTFNDLHANGCQVVVASDRPPTAIPGLAGRLCSRFQWGLIADIQPPDAEMRVAILNAKAAQQRIALPPEVARFLADRIRDNIRELEGSLNRVAAYARLTNSAEITLEVAASALSALTTTAPSPADPQAVIKAAASYFNIPLHALSGKSRARPVAEARHAAMYLLREDCQLALKQIGLLLGHRDHSTVIHGINKVAQSLLHDSHITLQIAELRSLVGR